MQCRRRAAARPRAAGQTRQLAAVAARQMPLGSADLLFDQMEVVDQPFAGRRDALIRRQGSVSRLHTSISMFSLSASRASSESRVRPRTDLVRGGERLAVLLHLIGAEKLRSQWRFFDGRRKR